MKEVHVPWLCLRARIEDFSVRDLLFYAGYGLTSANKRTPIVERETLTLSVERKAFFSSLHLAFLRNPFLMRKRIHWAARLILISLIASFASCQSGGAGGNRTSKADVTDPNVSFSSPAKRAEAP
jgi:hypothetical protein